MTQQLHFGIIGYGFMGQTHGETLRQLPYAVLEAVCDTNPDQLTKAPAGVAVFQQAADLLALEKINTVIIAVPNHLHLEVVALAAKAGKDIICEKPAALHAAEVEEMIAVTEAAGVGLTFHHQRRWDHDYRVAKEIHDQQLVGDMYTIKSSLYGFNGNMHDWHIYPEYGGGMLYDWGVHLLDQLLYMIPGKLKTVYADVRSVINQQVDDYFNIQLYFEEGIRAEVELGTYFLNDKEDWFERHWFIGGNTGSANIDGFFPKGSIVRTSELLTNVPGKITMTHAGPTRSFGPPPDGRLVTESLPEVHVNHQLFFDNYFNAVQKKEALVIQPAEILRLMRLVEAVRQSGSTHQSVNFE